MSITERSVDAPDHWPAPEALERAAERDVIVILPEQVDDPDGILTAFFRADAQELRVRAAEAGFGAVLLAPDGAELAGFSELAADWVLPVVLSAALTIPSTVVADMIYDHIANGGPDAAAHVVRYREAVVEQGKVKVREFEGPADEIARLLSARRQDGAEIKQATTGDEVTRTLPPLTDRPSSGETR